MFNNESINNRLKRIIRVQEGETCTLLVRKHWFVFVKKLFAVFFSTLITWVILQVFMQVVGISPAVITFWQAVVILIGVLSSFVFWTNHWLDMWVVTNKRVVHVDQINLFSRQVAATRIDRVQDVRAKVSGIVETILGFGNLQVQTAGASSSAMIIRGIPHPNKVRKVILKHLDEALSSASNHDGVGHS